MKKVQYAQHGEVGFYKTDCEIPKGAIKVDPKQNKWIVADSETTGNHHCVKEQTDIELFEKDGVLYMKCESEAEVFCVDKARHDTIMLPAGTWEIRKSLEYDHLLDEVRECID